MYGSCPRCGAGVEIPASGSCSCPRCRRAFRAYLAVRPEPPLMPAAQPLSPSGFAPSPQDPAAQPASEARCALHANNVAAGVCERCGDFTCSLCVIPLEGRNYCPNCFDLLWQRGSLEVTQRTFTTPQSARTLSLFSLLLFCIPWLSVPFAGIAMVLSISALRQIQRQPDLPGRNTAIAGLVLSGISLAVTILFLVFGRHLNWD